MVELEHNNDVSSEITPSPTGTPSVVNSPLDVGDSIYVVYWRPWPMPDNPKAGSWDVMSGTVVSSGRMVCFEIYTPSTPSGNGGVWEASPGSLLRFTNPDRVFRTEFEALEYLKTQTPK